MADKIRTMQSANAVVDTMEFRFDPDGTVIGVVYGHTTYAEGGNSPMTPYQTVVTGTLKTNVLAIRNGMALAFWKAQEGL